MTFDINQMHACALRDAALPEQVISYLIGYIGASSATGMDADDCDRLADALQEWLDAKSGAQQ